MDDVATVLPGATPSAPTGEAPASFRAVPWRWHDLAIGLVPLVAVRAGAWLVAPDALGTLPRWSWIGMRALGLAWMVAYPLGVARWRLGPIRAPRPRRVAVEGLIGLALLPVLFGAVMLFDLQWQRLGIDRAGSTAPLDAIARSPGRADTIALAVLAIALAPLAEEVFYRGFLYNGLRRRLPIALALLIQGVAYGLIHPFHVLGLATVALAAGLLALAYEWRKTLVAPIVLHAGQNVVRMLMITAAAAAHNATATLDLVGAPDERGQVVRIVGPGGAADRAGLRPGDVITAVDGAEFAPGDLDPVIRSHEPGDRVTLQYLRAGQPAEAEATLGTRTD